MQVAYRQVQRRLRQARVARCGKVAAQKVQPVDGAVQQGPDDRLRGRVLGQLVQVTLDHDRGVRRSSRSPSDGGSLHHHRLFHGPVSVLNA